MMGSCDAEKLVSFAWLTLAVFSILILTHNISTNNISSIESICFSSDIQSI